MKRTIIIEILLLFVLAVLLACTIKLFVYINDLKEEMEAYGLTSGFGYAVYSGRISTATSYVIPTFIAAIATAVAMVLVAVFNLPAFKPLVDEMKARKEQRAAAKAELAEVAKQQRIEKLQAELDELKKDE